MKAWGPVMNEWRKAKMDQETRARYEDHLQEQEEEKRLEEAFEKLEKSVDKMEGELK